LGVIGPVPLGHKNVRGCALFALQAAQTVDLVALHRVAVLSTVAAKTKR
jgi:hypothetical protein